MENALVGLYHEVGIVGEECHCVNVGRDVECTDGCAIHHIKQSDMATVDEADGDKGTVLCNRHFGRKIAEYLEGMDGT